MSDDPRQFTSFDGRDNRRELMILFQKLGDHLPEVLAREKRAEFLRRLVKDSKNKFAERDVKITPCGPVEAYFAFTAITGVLGVNIDRAASKLERLVKAQ
jgi:hypothetical protein